MDPLSKSQKTALQALADAGGSFTLSSEQGRQIWEGYWRRTWATLEDRGMVEFIRGTVKVKLAAGEEVPVFGAIIKVSITQKGEEEL